MRLDFLPSDRRDPNAEDLQDLLKQAASLWGSDCQLRRAQEEAADFIASVNKYSRDEIHMTDLAYDVATNLVMTMQVIEILETEAPGLVDSMVGQILHRLRMKIQNEKHQQDSHFGQSLVRVVS